jgi:hypothetical protein
VRQEICPAKPAELIKAIAQGDAPPGKPVF